MNHEIELTDEQKQVADTLFREGFLCRYEDRFDLDLVARRWELRTNVPQKSAKTVKEAKRAQPEDED